MAWAIASRYCTERRYLKTKGKMCPRQNADYDAPMQNAWTMFVQSEIDFVCSLKQNAVYCVCATPLLYFKFTCAKIIINLIS